MLSIDRLVKTYASSQSKLGKKLKDKSLGQRAVNEVSIEVEEGEMFTLLGPSGCGKTTTLRSIAGLEKPDSGAIRLKDRTLFESSQGINVPANQRGLGMVFQSYAIWPHLSVFRNVSFPLEVVPRAQRLSKEQIRERVERVLEVTGLTQYADRGATKLSGGQQQRLALARATVIEPPLMLLDEPLSNLDAALREEMRFELKRLQREMGITSIYVTHDQSEALALSSRIAVMKAGEIVQIGKPREIYHEPVNRFVAAFIGVSNFIDGDVATTAGGETKIVTPQGEFWTSRPASFKTGDEVSISLRPENISIEHDEGKALEHNQWQGTVMTRGFLGEATDHIVSVGKLELRVRSNPKLSFAPGTKVTLSVLASDVVVVPRSDDDAPSVGQEIAPAAQAAVA